MKYFKLLFLSCILYGIFTAQYGAAFLSLIVLGLVYFAERTYAQQDKSWLNSPAAASVAASTVSLLDSECCECNAIYFAALFSDSDS